jgi:hypothetical protein
VTFVFAEVAGVHKLSHKHHKSQLHAVNKTIQRCMLQQMAALPGRDGYLCRSHELKYMVAFESPVRAVQWCLLVQVRSARTGAHSQRAPSSVFSWVELLLQVSSFRTGACAEVLYRVLCQ